MKLNYSVSVPLWENPPLQLEDADDRIEGERIWSVGMPRMLFYPSHKSSPWFAVICPGGAYRKLNPIYEGEYIARRLTLMGINAYVLLSRLPNQSNLTVGYKATISDVQRAIKLIRSRHTGAKIIGIGVSAGGHLVSTLPFYQDLTDEGNDNPVAPDVIVMISPVTIMNKYSEWTHKGSLKNFGLDLSTYHHVTTLHPPTMLVHATDDDVVPVIHSLLYAEALAKHSIKFEMVVPSTGKHNVSAFSEWTEKLIPFINNNFVYEKKSNTPIL
jgi:acetyl esterase/lipase